MSKLFIALLANFRQSACIGSINFEAFFYGMTSPQSFIVHPHEQQNTSIIIQSATRIGEINLSTGLCRISREYEDGADIMNLAAVDFNNQVDRETLSQLNKALADSLALANLGQSSLQQIG